MQGFVSGEGNENGSTNTVGAACRVVLLIIISNLRLVQVQI